VELFGAVVFAVALLWPAWAVDDFVAHCIFDGPCVPDAVDVACAPTFAEDDDVIDAFQVPEQTKFWEHGSLWPSVVNVNIAWLQGEDVAAVPRRNKYHASVVCRLAVLLVRAHVRLPCRPLQLGLGARMATVR
jgi:hypothetical protein